MNQLSHISWKYYDHIRSKLKEVTPSRNSLIDSCHHVHNKFIARNYLSIGEYTLRFSIRMVTQGYMLVMICEPNEATFKDEKLFYSFIEPDRSILFQCFKEAIDEIFKKCFNC